MCGIVSKFGYFVWDCLKVCAFCGGDCSKVCALCLGLFQGLRKHAKTSLGRVSLAAIPTRMSPSHEVKVRETGLNVNRLVAQW